MRIGLISDTHIPWVARSIPEEVFRAFRGVDLILHAGDVYEPRVLDELERVAPVLAAVGDDDYPETILDKRVKAEHLLLLDGTTILLVHEWPRQSKPDFAAGLPSGRGQQSGPNVVVCGHTHEVALERTDDMLLVNPGSPTFLGYRRGLGSVAILCLERGDPQVLIVRLKSGASSVEHRG